MSHLSTTLLVDAPAEVVYDLLADPARAPEWQSLLTELGPVSGRPGGIGSSYIGFYRVAGRKLPAQFVVTAAERPSLHQVNGTTTGGWNRWTHVIEPEGDRCRVRISMEYELPGEIVGSLFGLLTGNRIEREFRRSYEQLQRLAEATAHSAPPRAPLPVEDDIAPDERRRARDTEPAEAAAG
jgi:ribosome-associated toxin RatA of RatAB toxin-antitoxin module